MKIQPLKIGTKTAKVPVIQGGMGSWYQPWEILLEQLQRRAA